MKKYTFMIAPLLLTVIFVASAAFLSIQTKQGVKFYKDSTWYDTTAAIDIKDYTDCYVTTLFTNTTTTDYTMKLYGNVAGKWVVLKTYTADSNKTTPIVKTIKNKDTNYLGGVTVFRIINGIHGGDSSNLLKYYQNVVLKK